MDKLYAPVRAVNNKANQDKIALSVVPAMIMVFCPTIFAQTQEIYLNNDDISYQLSPSTNIDATDYSKNGLDAWHIITMDDADRDRNKIYVEALTTIRGGMSPACLAACGDGDTDAGNGGNAVSGNNFTLTNRGRIHGGNSGGFSNTPGGEGGNGGIGITGNNLLIINYAHITGGLGGHGSQQRNAGHGGDAIVGENIVISNFNNIRGGNGGDEFTNGATGGDGGHGLYGDGFVITNNANSIIQGGAGRNGLYGGDGGAAIKGGNLTIINDGYIAGGYAGEGATDDKNGQAGKSIQFTGGANTLTMNSGSAVIDDIQMDAVTLLNVTDNTQSTGNANINGGLILSQNAEATLSGDRLLFDGDGTLGESSTLNLSGFHKLGFNGQVTFASDTALRVDAPVITDWVQEYHGILDAGTGKGIHGLSIQNVFVDNPLLADGAPDYAGAYLINNDDNLVYGLKWNATDSSAHGEFALRDGATLTLHTILADNVNPQTPHPGWDGKSLTKSGNGELILAARNAYSGLTHINGGTLRTSIDDAIASSSGVNVSEGATLNLAGYNQTLTALNNSGTILINDTGATPLTVPVTVTGDMTLRKSGLVVINNGSNNAGQVLIQNGDWQGAGGTVSLGVVLGEDKSKADQLDITGHASGTTNVLVVNENGSGAQTLEGIKLISTGSSDNNAFVQKNRIVAGSYDYHLQQGTASGQNTSNWYLTSYISPQPAPVEPTPDPVEPVTPDPDEPVIPDPVNPAPHHSTHIWRPEAGSYVANLMAANTMFNHTLEDRHGSIVIDPVTGQRYETTLWVRAVGGHNAFRMTDEQSKTTANRMVYQMGGEMLSTAFGEQDGLHLGIMGAYGRQDSKTINNFNGYTARGTVSGYATGLYSTWFSNDNSRDGLYVDSWVQYGWFDNSVKGDGLAEEKYDSKGLMASLETGYVYPAYSWTSDNGTDNTLYLRPMAQATWSGVKADNHTERNGTVVKSAGTDNIQTKLGLRVSITGQSHLDKGSVRKFEPFAEVNWVWNSGQYGVTMGDVSDHLKGSRSVAELKAGVEGRLTNNLGLWGSVAQQVGVHSYSDTQGMVGLKYSF